MSRDAPTLVEELKQTRPFASAAEESVVAILRTTALLKRALARRIESRGVSMAQYNVLRILRGAGEGGLPTLAVRDRLVEEAPGITRLIDKLERSRLVVRVRDAGDRRTVRCCITPAGLRLLEQIEPQLREVNGIVEAALPAAADRRALLESLSKLRAALHAECAPARRSE